VPIVRRRSNATPSTHVGGMPSAPGRGWRKHYNMLLLYIIIIPY